MRVLPFASTGAIFLGMAALSTVIKRDLSGMGKFLFVGVIVVLLAAAANIFLQIPALSLTVSAAFVLLMSGLIPAVPFSVLNYAAGASAVRLLPYTLATIAGLLPGTLMRTVPALICVISGA